MFCYRSCLSLQRALICTAWCHPHVYMGLIHVLAFPAPVSLQRPSSSLRLVDCWDGAIATYVEWPQESTTCPPSEWGLLDLWCLSYPCPLVRATQTRSSTHPTPTEIFTKSSTCWTCWLLVYGLTFPSLFPGHYPSYLCPTSGHTSLCVSRFLAHFLLPLFPALAPLINGMLFFKLHKRPTY